MPDSLGVRLKEILPPGRSLSEAARALGGARQRAGKFPYQWLFPGPNSKAVRASGAVLIPDAYGTPATVVTYLVPEGMRFAFRGIVVDCTSPDWNQGSGDIIFSLSVSAGVGVRPVEDYGLINTTLGSRAMPFPVLGRLEFQSNDRLTLTVTPVANVSLSPNGGYAMGMLVGHTYPNAEAGEG